MYLSIILHTYITCVTIHNSTFFLQWWVNCPLYSAAALSLKRAQVATLIAATRGRRRLFLLLPPFRFWLVGQKVGESLCSRDERHCQAIFCEEKIWEGINKTFLYSKSKLDKLDVLKRV